MLKVAVLGARGIGSFHTREFLAAKTDVVAVLGSTEESAAKTSQVLHDSYGVRPTPYSNIDALLASENLDAVSVCTPPSMHYEQTKKCLTAGLHVLCEKPFVQNSETDNTRFVQELIELSSQRKRILSVNTQWVSVLPYLAPHIDIGNLSSFSMFSQPGQKGTGLLLDHLAHCNSILVHVISDGKVSDIRFSSQTPTELKVEFSYTNKRITCNVQYQFMYKAERPRDISFGFNGVEFKRIIGESYQQRLISGDVEIDIEDPLKKSIALFIGAIEGRNAPLVSTEEIYENMKLQDEIVSSYLLASE